MVKGAVAAAEAAATHRTKSLPLPIRRQALVPQSSIVIRRKLMNLKWRLAALPFLIACGANKLDTAASLHRDSEALWRHGFTRKAIELADQGWRQWKNDRADQWHWKFCLLEAELLLNQGSSVRA